MRLIDADAFKEYMRDALEKTRNCFRDNGKWAEEVTEEFCKDIDEQPTIEERKKGEWIKVDKNNIFFVPHILQCSICGDILDKYGVNAGRGDANYCPHCGADMRGERDETD